MHVLPIESDCFRRTGSKLVDGGARYEDGRQLGNVRAVSTRIPFNHKRVFAETHFSDSSIPTVMRPSAFLKMR